MDPSYVTGLFMGDVLVILLHISDNNLVSYPS